MFILTCSVPHCPFDQPIDSHRRREFTSGRIPVSISTVAISAMSSPAAARYRASSSGNTTRSRWCSPLSNLIFGADSVMPHSTANRKGFWCKYMHGAQQSRWSGKDYAASTASQILGREWFLRRRRPRANWPLRIRRSSSMPAMVVAAQSKFLKPSIGPVLDLIPR